MVCQRHNSSNTKKNLDQFLKVHQLEFTVFKPFYFNSLEKFKLK